MLDFLDLATLQAIHALLYVTAFLLVLLLRVSGQRFHGSGFWVASCGLLTAGVATFSIKPVGDLLLCLGMALLCVSLYRFRLGQKPLFWPLVLPVAIIVPGMAFPNQALWFSSMLSALLLASFSAAAGITLGWYGPKNQHRHDRYYSIPFLITCLFFLIRFVALLIKGADFVDERVFLLLGSLTTPGMVTGYFLFSANTTNRILHKKDSRLEERNTQLSELIEIKDHFVALLTHDLRGPIGSSARIAAALLRDGSAIRPDAAMDLGAMSQSLDRAHRLLENLILWNRSRTKAWAPDFQAIDLSLLCADQLSLLAAEAHRKNIALDATYVEGIVWADRQSVELIVRNLVGNAIKFSNQGATCTLETRFAGSMIELHVIDQGIGISLADMGRLFQTKHPVSGRGTAGETGTGLGLMMCRDYATRNYGTLILESGNGPGTRAILSLLAAPPISPSAT